MPQFIQQEDNCKLDSILLRNFLELCYIVEDLVHANADIIPNPQFTCLVHNLISTAESIGVLNCTYP